jgi:hypothetical protein
VLDVELTINDESYTSDNKTYGFFDPFVLDAIPRLIATDGTTQVQIKGIGFVDSADAKALYNNRSSASKAIGCGSVGISECTRKATFVDKSTLLTSTYPQAEVRYTDTGNSVMWDPMSIDATVIGDEFTNNQVHVFYYENPTLLGANINEAPANLEAQIIITSDFGAQSKTRLVKYASPKCRFTYGAKVVISEAQLLHYPFTASRDPEQINAFHCKSPKWQLDAEEAEKATLDLSLNGQNFVGGLDFTFGRILKIHRDIPMSGPKNHASQVRAIGQGYRLHGRDTDLKWGTQATDPIANLEVLDYTYGLDRFLISVPGS